VCVVCVSVVYVNVVCVSDVCEMKSGNVCKALSTLLATMLQIVDNDRPIKPGPFCRATPSRLVDPRGMCVKIICGLSQC